MADIGRLTLTRQPIHRIEVPITGTAPLIVHRWDEKAKEMLLSAQQSKTRKKKEAKDPDADYEASKYRLPDGTDGFPAVGFKAAIVGAARLFEGVTMTQLKTIIYVEGTGPDLLVPIRGKASMRTDMVRVGMGVADIRFRCQYDPWEATLYIRFNPAMLDAEGVIALVSAAGQGGVGEWRPSSPKGLTGSFGTWDLVDGGDSRTEVLS